MCEGRMKITLKIALVLMFAFSVFSLSARQVGEGLIIVVISDINESYGSTSYSSHLASALAYIASLTPDLVICAGDMVAGQKLELDEDRLRAMWGAFDDHVLSRLRRHKIPFAFTLGNHDGSSSPKFKHERMVDEKFWIKRRPDLHYVDSAKFPACYSFVFAGVFFAAIDASAANIIDEHKSWLTDQLQGEAARSARLRVVLGHLPMYAIAEGRNRTGDVVNDADSLHALLKHGGVDYYISGHHHAFYSSVRDGVRMISAGALGGGPRKLLGSDAAPVKTMTTLYLPTSGNAFRILSHDMSNNMKTIRLSDLPDELPGFNGVSKKYDPDALFAD